MAKFESPDPGFFWWIIIIIIIIIIFFCCFCFFPIRASTPAEA